MRARLAVLGALPVVLALGACENDFYLRELQPESPAQVSVVSTDGAVIVHWSAVDGALDYAVFVSIDGEVAGSRSPECEQSPCRVNGLEPGQLYYARVVSIFEGFDPEADLDRTADLEVVSTRAGFAGQNRGPFAWAGTALLGEDNASVSLFGMWFEDDEVGPSVEHVCATYWEDGVERILDPCTNADLSSEGSGAAAELGNECKVDVCHPVFEVQAEDGRYGQAFTTVVVP